MITRLPGLGIGVTGHRVLAEPERLAAGIEQAIDRIERVFPIRPLIVYSSLAEGADRLAAECVLARPDSRLHVALPLPREDYLTDFATAESRQHFLGLLHRSEFTAVVPAAGTREEAYAATGRYLLDHVDVLIAVWDGRDAQGTGGTAEIVSLARKRGLPLAWIRAGNRRPGTLEATSLGDEQGRVSFERFPDRAAR